MKKLSFFLMAMLFSVMSFATEVTVTIGDYAAANGWVNSTAYDTLTMDEVVTVTANPTTGTSNNTGKYYDNGKNWRMYQNEAPAIVVTAAEGYQLTSVTFTYANKNTGVMVDADSAQVASGTAVALEKVASATFSVGNTNANVTNGNVQITEITVAYEAAEEEPVVTVPTNAELWEAFKPYYNTYYGLTRADQPIDKVSTFASAKMQEIMTDSVSEYKWLGDYVLSVATAAGVTLSTDMAAASESAWRWAVHAFFNAAPGQYGATGIDFTEAGKPENWGPYYLAAQTPGEPEIEWIEMPLEISNLTTMEMPVEGVTYLQLMGRNDMAGADVMLFLNNYTGEEKAYEVNVENSFMTFGGTELTIMDGSITKSVDPELGDVFAGIVHASAVEEGVTLYVALDLKMYAQPAIKIAIEDVEITVNEESAIAFFKATWEGSPLQVEVSGFEEVESKEYSECWLSIGDDVNWVDAAAGPATITIKNGVASLEGTFTSFATGKTYEVILSGKLPVKEEPAEKPVITAAELEQITGDEDIFHFYLSQGVAVDKNPESPYYGYTYVTAATDGADDGSSDRADTQKRGIFVFDAELNSLNPDNVGFLPANADSLMTDVSRQAMHRIAINPVNNHVVFCYNVAGASAIWSMDPANLAGDAVNLIEGLAITKANAFCFDAEGTLYVMDNANTSDGGTIVKVVNGELDTVAKNTIWGVQDISLASDGRGGLWVAQNRWAVDAFAVLSHVNAAGAVDFAVTGSSPDEVKALFPNDFNASYRGQCAYNVDKDILAFGGNKVVTLFYVTYDAAGVPSIAKIGATPAIGNNIDGVDFYANGDLAVVSASAERFKKFAVTYTVEGGEPEIEWIEMPLEIANLTTEEMEVEGAKYLLLQGRDDMNGAEVMLFLNNYTGEEKAYEVNVENSFMTFGGTELTIMDGSITKSVDPELGDVFAGIVHASAVEEGVTLYVALDLKMYAQPAIKIAIEDVEITVNEESAIAFFKATWEGSPLQVEVSGFEEVESKEYSECWLSIGDNVNWVDAAAGPAAITIKDGVASLVGTFTSYATGKTYEVTLSGKLPQDPGSGLDNVQVDAKAVKVIKNGMLIINRDGKEYNVQGATLK